MICPHCKEEIINKCIHCGRKWEPRKENTICPDCKRSDWDIFPVENRGAIGRPKQKFICQKTCDHPHSQECDNCSKYPKYSNYK